MPALSAAEMWLGMTVLGIATLWMAIVAGRTANDFARVLALLAELGLGGASLVAWFFVVWLLAKTLMAFGPDASTALLVAIAAGLVLIVPAVVSCWLIVRTTYRVLGRGATFAADLRNSLWLSKGGTWRPGDT